MPKKPDDNSSTGDPTSTGAGTKWFVKGGTFQFRIASDFAVKDVTITAKPLNRDSDSQDVAATVTPSTSTIFSKPMHVNTEITSTLTVTVKNENTGEIIDNWTTAVLVPKDVPTAIWDPYSQALDPSNKPAQLLNGNNATVKQCMSLMLTAPPPELCPPPTWPGFIPKFKATAAMKFGIRDFTVDKHDGTDWFVPASEPKQAEYLPRELTDAEKKESNQDRWNEVRNAWDGMATQNDQVMDKDGLLDMWAKTLIWDQKRPQTEDTPGPATGSAGSSGAPKATLPLARQPWQLIGGLPLKMIKNLEGTYLDLPRLAVVNA